ncbi:MULTISPECIES: hypothetical protein [Bradyrhizobium]|nr:MULTISPECIES: hypothetical protein [Bradyrhizobium]QOG18607.1 hypothetical protein FOM02_15935 [Bradyrhizobium sp. SEMIA]SFU95479.1 hypothetical protein SAMN05192541_10888 [Bradyrhizobium arachidis]
MMPNDREWIEILVETRMRRIRAGNQATLQMLQRSIEMIASAEALLAAPVPRVWPRSQDRTEELSEHQSDAD